MYMIYIYIYIYKFNFYSDHMHVYIHTLSVKKTLAGVPTFFRGFPKGFLTGFPGVRFPNVS